MKNAGIIFAVVCFMSGVVSAKAPATADATTRATTAPTLVTMKCNHFPATQAVCELLRRVQEFGDDGSPDDLTVLLARAR